MSKGWLLVLVFPVSKILLKSDNQFAVKIAIVFFSCFFQIMHNLFRNAYSCLDEFLISIHLRCVGKFNEFIIVFPHIEKHNHFCYGDNRYETFSIAKKQS